MTTICYYISSRMWLIDWLIFIEHITNVYALVTIENKLQHIRGTGKTRQIKERNTRTLEQKYKHW